MLNWRDLVVTDDSGDEWGPLGELIDSAPANLDNAEIREGHIAEWPGFLISAPGDVDWTGFEQALAAVRGKA